MAKNPGLLKSSSWIAWVSLLRNQYPEMISGRGKFLSGDLMPCPCQCGRSRTFSATAIAAAPALITMPTIAQNTKRKLMIGPSRYLDGFRRLYARAFVIDPGEFERAGLGRFELELEIRIGGNRAFEVAAENKL